ncbi:MAG: hypothetical protein JWO96_85 [Candidatus Saccharibacteria bacterium]|nr:hypothetical protein [Candidatus Saccharibacteria bacterium]
MSAEKANSKAAPKAGKDTIYVDVDDDITTIIDKVVGAKEKVAALVLPKRASALQSIVNMRLLRRSAEKAGKNVVLITAESALLPLAGAAGIHVAKNLQSKPAVPVGPEAPAALTPQPPVPEGADEDEVDDKTATLDYHRSIGELAAVHAADEVITLDDKEEEELPKPKTPKSSAAPQAKGQKIKKIKVPNFERFRLMMIAGVVAVVGIIVFIILAIFVLPKATVTVQTSSIPVSANFTLNTSDKFTSLNESANQIPASLKATKQTSNQTVNATGQQNNGDRATGTMSFYNCNSADTLSGTDRVVPAGTGVSANGLTYITQQSVTVSPSHFTGSTCKNDVKSSSVDVKAQIGGAKYNQDSTTYSVAGYSTITGNGSKMTGGTDNNATVVSQADLDSARQKVTSASTDDFTKQFEKQLSDQGFYVLASTLKLNDPEVTSTPSLGQAASTVNVTINITYNVLVVPKADLRKAISDTLSQQIDSKKQKLSNDDVLTGANVSIQNQTAPAAATLTVTEDTTAIPIIDVAQVKKLAAGQKSGDIQAAISGWPGVKNVNIKMSPFWVSKAPKHQNKIIVKLEQVKG